jgi:hypothetical protein
VVHAPIAPGLVVPVGVSRWWPLRPGDTFTVAAAAVIAVDGEREIELARGERASVTLLTQGPRCIDVRAAMAEAARRGLLRRERQPHHKTYASPHTTEASLTEP